MPSAHSLIMVNKCYLHFITELLILIKKVKSFISVYMHDCSQLHLLFNLRYKYENVLFSYITEIREIYKYVNIDMSINIDKHLYNITKSCHPGM